MRYIAWNGRRGLGLCSSAALIKCLHACFQINAFRFDDTEVLGDRIEMSWFKDLRKAKQQGGYTFHERLRKLYYKCDLSIITVITYAKLALRVVRFWTVSIKDR